MNRPRPFVYVSIDIEADGPIPGAGANSMLSLGAAAFDPTIQGRNRFTPVATFEANLQPLPGAITDPKTMEWWKTQPEAYAAATLDARPASTVIPEFIHWLRHLPDNARPVAACYPVGFDFTFVHWYNTKFGDILGDPFGFSALDIKTLAAAALKVPYPEAVKRNMPKTWFKGPDGKAPKHTHKALDDALGQGILLLNILDHLAAR